ncbi:class I SAM-dependent DNA methyltransferase [Paracoccus sp. P2]|uniref:HsdM family class I SAM-dependent methyltransferase n=1 Tax=Paracoccus sp. P2 TaxID=3248840 RepID=UPI00391F41CA
MLFDIEQPTSLLQAVDDALVERLDSWREKAVRYSRSAVTKVDSQLQTLYAQLFVLRTVEDRGLDDVIPRIASAVISPDSFDFDAWKVILSRAKQRIGSDLFSDDVVLDIEPHILCGVVRDLYVPKKVPGADAKYDFSWISADVLGLAYEKYLSTVLQPAPLPLQSELFFEPQRGVERVSVRKSAGAYYTPRFLTSYLAATCVDRYFSDPEKDDLPKVIDFSCGSGSFLVAAVDRVLGHLKRKDANRSWARELIESGCIVGVDIDPKAVTAARLHLWQRLIEEPNALPLPNLSAVIISGDGLDATTWGDLNREYDIVLGNPPYLATSMVANREKLEGQYLAAKGRYDFSSLFVEQAVNILKPGGFLGLVIPNRTFINKNATAIRDILTRSTMIKSIVDFGTSKVFDADAYVGCIVAQKNSENTSPKTVLRVIRVNSLDPDFMAAELIEAEHLDKGRESSAV